MAQEAGMIPGLREPAKRKGLRARELDFHSSSRTVQLPQYKPMFDVHLQHLWVNPRIRQTMQSAGFLDDDGKPVDVDAHRRKLFVIEQELAQADMVERYRARDKERKREEMIILAKRQEVHQQRIDAVQAVREGRRRRREVTADGMARSTSSLPAIGNDSPVS